MSSTTETVRISEGGRVVIPAPFRKALNMNVGDEVIVELEDGEVRLRTRAEGIRRAREILGDILLGPSPVEELIAERRAEAARD
jgi:AbrB family looped-hinge helix DNA binding protein